MKLTAELVERFENHMALAVESLLSESLRLPVNPEGYALFREGPVLATLSTNPHAAWATQAYGLTGRPADVVGRVIDFYEAHRVPACIRIVPSGFSADQADVLSERGLRHTGFQTIAWSLLPLPRVAGSTLVDVREVSTPAELDAHIDIQLLAYAVPPEIIERRRPLRRPWLGTAGRRLYLAYVDGQPAAQAMLYWRGDIAYLEGAGTLPAFRRRGLQTALIHRRIADATALGCQVIFCVSEFASQSLANQMACGLSIAYVVTRWSQRVKETLPFG